MPIDLTQATQLAQAILDINKGVEAQRAELARLQGLVIEAQRQRDALGADITARTREKASLERAVSELQRDKATLADAKATLTEDNARLVQERDTLASELAALRTRVGLPV